jgi:hypothetical protein
MYKLFESSLSAVKDYLLFLNCQFPLQFPLDAEIKIIQRKKGNDIKQMIDCFYRVIYSELNVRRTPTESLDSIEEAIKEEIQSIYSTLPFGDGKIERDALVLILLMDSRPDAKNQEQLIELSKQNIDIQSEMLHALKIKLSDTVVYSIGLKCYRLSAYENYEYILISEFMNAKKHIQRGIKICDSLLNDKFSIEPDVLYKEAIERISSEIGKISLERVKLLCELIQKEAIIEKVLTST